MREREMEPERRIRLWTRRGACGDGVFWERMKGHEVAIEMKTGDEGHAMR